MLNVRIGGVTFEGSPRDRDDAFVIAPDGWSGWDDGVAVRREAVSRPSAHGSFAFPGFRDARVVSLSGWIVASSPEKLHHKRDQLLGLLADGGSGTLTVEQPKGTRWATVMLSDTPTVRVRGVSECEAEFRVQFWAPDPRMFGEVRDYAAGETAIQYGNFPARPQLIVSGSAASGYTVTGPGGRSVVVSKALTSGQPHTIDFARGGLYVGGVRQLRAMTVYEPWTVGPGLPGAVATVNNGVSLVQRVTDTYV